MTGQNTTTVPGFRGLEANRRFSALTASYQTCMVSLRSVDSFIEEHQIRPAFIKIDTEGFDRAVAATLADVLRDARPYLKTEIYKHMPEPERAVAVPERAGTRLIRAGAGR